MLKILIEKKHFQLAGSHFYARPDLGLSPPNWVNHFFMTEADMISPHASPPPFIQALGLRPIVFMSWYIRIVYIFASSVTIDTQIQYLCWGDLRPHRKIFH